MAGAYNRPSGLNNNFYLRGFKSEKMSIVPEAVEYHILNIPSPVLMMLLTWGIIISVSLYMRLKMSMIPRGISGFFELIFSFIFNSADSAIGPEAPRYYPLFLGVFVFVLVGNFIGLVPGFSSPTANINITLGLAIISFTYYQYQGVKKHGAKYLLHFFGPRLPWYLTPINVLMFFVEIISHFARVISLSLRLFCNIFAKEVLLGILASLFLAFFLGPTLIEKGLSVAVFFLRPLIILLGVLVSFVQAFIFAALSIIYVAGAVKEGH
ncbi:MAG TPA: ATP synthase F0 subunit A [Elusimicrobia bacterium]|nr:ATP synthase F0 subunit A [Elusimicrobiota bacterium]